ncbi:ubiquitin carboxyl-terminal hydrolase-domain-containing protein [Podospora didyma]|uniref:PAN2-PAN3 deadenylation complex catalytic subunit PAN2 n=1 Tax=Podospora didyma TaxID=330526 RepID=A0AAE0NHF2_9PEZI|nr:ubiquitin carboxyl-terminal hydrolase-domain-containing protein [Podospora didyma]
METDWAEVTRTTFPAPGSSDYPRPATALAFDHSQELLWVGSDRGRVVSYGRELQQYTAFRIQPASEGPVRQILIHEKGIIALGTRSIHMAMRRGPALWNIRHENMKDLHCMSYTSRGASEILVAGWQDTMFVIDVLKGEIVKQVGSLAFSSPCRAVISCVVLRGSFCAKVPTEYHYTIMKKSRYICAATKTGCVNMLDLNSLEVVKTWQAHASYINDMDAQHDFIVTCGGSLKQHAAQPYMLDTYVNVFDLKNMNSMKPMPFPLLAAYVRLHPRMLTTSIVVSQHGQMHVVDLMNPDTNNARPHQANMGFLSMFEIAPSGEALALTDTDCNLCLWGSPTKIHFTDMAKPVELPEAEEPPPEIDWSMDTPLSSVGLPYYRDVLFSGWPADIVSNVGAPPLQPDAAFMSKLKKTDWGYYGPNPNRTRLRRNQAVEDTRASMRASTSSKKHQFHSEKERYTNSSSSFDQSADSVASGELDSLKPEAPQLYLNQDIKYSKFGIEDFDFSRFNATSLPGLENHIANSYANSLLQLLHYTPLLRNMALQHAATACLSDPCLLCELGFLFDMLHKAEVPTCQATNMLKALSNTPQAGPLGLLEEEAHPPEPTTMAQNLTRFLFDKISQEYRSISAVSTILEQTLFNLPHPITPEDLVSRVLTTSAVVSIKCLNCSNEHTRPGNTLVNELMYPPQKVAARGGRAPRTTFSQVLKVGVERETTNKGWCQRCSRYQNLQMRKSIQTIPAVLAINTSITTQDQRRLWATPGWLPEEIGIIVDQGQFFCYEGEDLKLHLQRGIHDITVYSLIGMVDNIDSNSPRRPHLVSVINVAHAAAAAPGESQWYLFNDFTVEPISSEEALTFNAAWKMPAILLYQLKAANNKTTTDWKTNMDTSILFNDTSPDSEEKTYRVLDPETERPGPDTIVAMDTEFVSVKHSEIEMNADGESEVIRPTVHAIARVSCVRGQGEDEGKAFIDDYITIREPIVDYVTAYSGIKPGDLDPRTSKHHLVSLKTAYKKLWVLLNLGCKFLGHGLKQDFRVMNIQVPRSQVIDTIDVFFLKHRKRKLGLGFLAGNILKKEIQLDEHDSIEDAAAALGLYRKYLEFEDAGILEMILEGIYKEGQKTNYKPKRKDGQVVQRTDTPPIPLEGSISSGGPGPGPGPSTPSRKAGGMVPGSGSAFGSVPVFTPSK